MERRNKHNFNCHTVRYTLPEFGTQQTVVDNSMYTTPRPISTVNKQWHKSAQSQFKRRAKSVAELQPCTLFNMFTTDDDDKVTNKKADELQSSLRKRRKSADHRFTNFSDVDYSYGAIVKKLKAHYTEKELSPKKQAVARPHYLDVARYVAD